MTVDNLSGNQGKEGNNMDELHSFATYPTQEGAN